jgi:hypothetical protein
MGRMGRCRSCRAGLRFTKYTPPGALPLQPPLLGRLAEALGLATAAAAAGAGDRSIQKRTGHKSRAMLDRYIRSAELFKDNAAGTVGL